MQKTKIEWVKNPNGSQGYSWNPIQGLCPVNCWYCYGRKYYQWRRPKHDWSPYFINHLAYHNALHKTNEAKKSRGIFICSTFDLFHPITKESSFPLTSTKFYSWRNAIFDFIEACPQHRFYILTKMPENIDREMPDNVWLGVTVESGNEIDRTYRLLETKAKVKFVSFEPLLGGMWIPEISHISLLDWIIVGRLTRHGKDQDPIRWWIDEIIGASQEKPIFLKDNLRDIWGEPLIQEFPGG